MYQAILFDLDNTLYDFQSFWSHRLDLGLAEVVACYPHIHQETLRASAMEQWVFIEQLPNFLRNQGITDEALIASAQTAYAKNWFDDMMLPEDTRHVLLTLRARYKLGLITNGPTRVQRNKIERFGLANLMDILLVSGEVGIAKPDPAIFQLALAQLGVQAHQALFVGDSPEHDICGAVATGIDAVWLNRFGATLPAHIPCPHATIQRLDELLPLLEYNV